MPVAIFAQDKESTQSSDAAPGLNDRFLDPQLDLSEWIGRFEMESREVYAARERVLSACQIKSGFVIADVGAGTGFYSRLFSSAAGETGWVFSVDISPRFLQHINERSK
ncbi:MAG: class I SAM-dependent methyltransferase, partial [Rubripirellula sp.]